MTRPIDTIARTLGHDDGHAAADAAYRERGFAAFDMSPADWSERALATHDAHCAEWTALGHSWTTETTTAYFAGYREGILAAGIRALRDLRAVADISAAAIMESWASESSHGEDLS